MVTETLGGPPPLPASRRIFARPLLAAGSALIVGIGVDMLALRRPIGLGVSIAMLIGVGVVLAGRAANMTYPVAFRWLLPAAAFMALAIAWRSSATLGALSLFAYSVIIAISVRLYEGAPLRSWTLTDYVWRGGGAASGIVEGAGRFLRYDAAVMRPASGFSRIRPALIGLAAAIPVLALFLALFVAADAVFAEYVSRVFSIDVEVARFVSRLATSLLLALVAVGCVRAVRSGFRDRWALAQRPVVPAVPVATGLAAVILLFAAFVAVQVRYLFGGASVLDVVDLTYSEYARRGFFEMVAVAVLVVVLIAVADWFVDRSESKAKLVDVGAVSLVLLTMLIVASAAVRMRLYTEVFGLTELRFYTSVFMGWTAVVLVLLLATVLRRDRSGFALGLLVSGLVFIGALTTVNPDAVIVAVNIDRHLEGAELDYEYVANLGPDAIPTLVASVDQVDNPCLLAAVLADAGSSVDRDEWGWRSATVAHVAATDSLASLTGCD